MNTASETRGVFAPPEWRLTKLGDACEIQLEKMLSPKSRTGERPIPYLRNANVQWNRFDLAEMVQMDFTEEQEQVRLRCDYGFPDGLM